MKKRWIILLCLMLAACASPVARHLNGSLTPPPGMAYALVSLTASGHDIDNAQLAARFHALDGDKHQDGAIYASLATDTIFSRQVGGPMVDGRLSLITLKPGHYQFYSASGRYQEDTLMLSTHSTVWRTFKLNLPFDVKAGEVVYLGEINLDLSNLPEWHVRDSRERDLGHVVRIWQVPDVSMVHTRLLAAGH